MTGAERAAFSAAMAGCDVATVDYCSEGSKKSRPWVNAMRPAVYSSSTVLLSARGRLTHCVVFPRHPCIEFTIGSNEAQHRDPASHRSLRHPTASRAVAARIRAAPAAEPEPACRARHAPRLHGALRSPAAVLDPARPRRVPLSRCPAAVRARAQAWCVRGYT